MKVQLLNSDWKNGKVIGLSQEGKNKTRYFAVYSDEQIQTERFDAEALLNWYRASSFLMIRLWTMYSNSFR